MLWVGSLRLCQYPVPCQISMDYSWWINHLCACCQMEIFYSHHSFYMDLLAFYHKEKLFPFSSLFVSPRVHGFLFYNQFLSLFIFMPLLSQIWQVEASSSWCLSATDKALSSFSTSLFFGNKKRFHTHPELSQDQPRNWPCLQGAMVPFRGEWCSKNKSGC